LKLVPQLSSRCAISIGAAGSRTSGFTRPIVSGGQTVGSHISWLGGARLAAAARFDPCLTRFYLFEIIDQFIVCSSLAKFLLRETTMV
jgi:hypothetical protein